MLGYIRPGWKQFWSKKVYKLFLLASIQWQSKKKTQESSYNNNMNINNMALQ